MGSVFPEVRGKITKTKIGMKNSKNPRVK